MRTWESSRKSSGVTEGMAVSQELGCSRKEGAMEVKCKARGLEAAAARGKEGPHPTWRLVARRTLGKPLPCTESFRGSGYSVASATEGKTDVHRNGCVGHFPMTGHTEKDLGWEMALEEGCTEPCGAEGAGVEGSLGLEMMLDTVGTHRALRQKGSPTPPAQGRPGQSGTLALEERGPFQTL